MLLSYANCTTHILIKFQRDFLHIKCHRRPILLSNSQVCIGVDDLKLGDETFHRKNTRVGWNNLNVNGRLSEHNTQEG